MRAPGIYISLARRRTVDLERLQRGELQSSEQELLLGYVSSRGNEYILDLADINVLKSASSVEWEPAGSLSERCGVDAQTIDLLVEYGFLRSDQDAASSTPEPPALSLWSTDALYFHQRSKWKGQDAGLPVSWRDEDGSNSASEDYFSERAELLGPIPHHFHARAEPDQRIALDLDPVTSPLTQALGDRRTTRSFDTDKALGIDTLSAATRLAFGCHGTAQLASQVVGLRKTSPSGGAMHPIEVYPLVIKVDGLEPGLYHYHPGDHALEPLTACSESEARALASRFTAGQNYYATANVMFLYTARFERSYWKYRNNPRAYRVALLDLGHVSQTLYLTCADLGVGAFFTAACNEVDIEEALEIDGIGEAALGIGGMGIPAADAAAMGLKVSPYTPPRATSR